MLCLTRTNGESLMIGDEIEVTVVRVAGSKVVLGINAPSDVPVNRKEVQDAINRGFARKGVKRMDRADDSA
jgi:carbon storage regulator